MTYRLEPWIDKINSIVTVILPDGTLKRYISGSVAATDIFDKHHVVKSLSAVGGEILIQLEEVEAPSTTWIGEEQQGFF